MQSVRHMEARLAIGHGINDGTSAKERDISMVKYYLQTSTQRALMYPYKKIKSWYYGPRLKWMKLIKDKKIKKKKYQRED